MEDAREGCVLPPSGWWEAVMEPDGEGDAGSVADTPGQDTQPAKHVPVYVSRFRGVSGFPERLFYSGHLPLFLELLHVVPHKDMEAILLVEGTSPLQRCFSMARMGPEEL